MAVQLTKGKSVSLKKTASSLGISSLHKVNVGLGWDINKTGGSSFDLDAWALAITNGELKKKNLVYFGNTADSSRSIVHCGDNLTGKGDGDDETITINLDTIPNDYSEILLGVTIYRAAQKRQAFKDVDNAFVRIYDKNTSIEICKYSDQFKNELGNFSTVLFGSLKKVNNEWTFNALGQGSKVSSISETLNVFKSYVIANETTSDNSSLIDTSNKIKDGGQKVMAVSLSKGGKVSLAKVASDAGIQGGLTKITVGLGWDVNRYDGGADFDLDAAAFMLGASGKVRSEKDFVFYNNKDNEGVTHTGDNRTGAGDGDDEAINVDLSVVPADVEKISFTVTIDQAEQRNQNFGAVENAYIRVLDQATGAELIRYDLTEDFSVETAIVVAELYRHNGEWKFSAVGSGFSGGLAALCGNFGISVG